jgi:PBSX family phage terminase large subunit
MQTIEIPIEYKRLFDTDWREAAIYGGRYSLKSHTVARALLIIARQKKTRVACFREFQNSIADSSHQLLADLIKTYELTDFKVTDKSIVNTINGSDFLFKGLHHNEQSVKSTEGIDYAWIEEAQTVSTTSIEVLTPTVRKPGSKIIYTYNRLLEEDPVHKRLVLEGRPNTLIIHANYDIAEKYGYLPPEIKNEIEDDKLNRPALYKHKWLGEPNSLERRVYKDWVQVENVPHEARLERRGLDFGYTNDPTAIVAIYYYNGGYILDEECYRKGMKNNHIGAVLQNLPDSNTLVIGDSAEPKSIADLRDQGINILGVKKVGSNDTHGNKKTFKQYGIDFVGQQKISVTKRSHNIWREYLTYLNKEDKDGRILNEPEDGNDHAMDATLYGFMGLRPSEPEEENITSGNIMGMFAR